MAKIRILGNCPKCGSEFIMASDGYTRYNYCSKENCKFIIGETKKQIILEEGESFRNYTIK